MKIILSLLASALLAGCATAPKQVTRYAWVTGLKPEKIERYEYLHSHPWPTINKMIKDCHIQNYSIYLRQFPDGAYYLFSYLEYTGADFEGDMAKMAADPVTQDWWAVCKPMQIPIANAKEGEWWADLEEVFHCD